MLFTVAGGAGELVKDPAAEYVVGRGVAWSFKPGVGGAWRGGGGVVHPDFVAGAQRSEPIWLSAVVICVVGVGTDVGDDGGIARVAGGDCLNAQYSVDAGTSVDAGWYVWSISVAAIARDRSAGVYGRGQNSPGTRG